MKLICIVLGIFLGCRCVEGYGAIDCAIVIMLRFPEITANGHRVAYTDVDLCSQCSCVKQQYKSRSRSPHVSLTGAIIGFNLLHNKPIVFVFDPNSIPIGEVELPHATISYCKTVIAMDN